MSKAVEMSGVYIPRIWYGQIKMDSGKSDTIGTTLLAHFAYGVVDIYADKSKLTLREAHFTIDNENLHQLFGLTDRQIEDTIDRLVEGEYLITAKIPIDTIKKFCCDKRPSRYPNTKHDVPISVCNWCVSDTFIVHEHHYPTGKQNGGTITVKICPNCHADFHYLRKLTFYRINPDKIMKMEGDNDG